MAKWEKKSIFDCEGKMCYFDEYGLAFLRETTMFIKSSIHDDWIIPGDYSSRDGDAFEIYTPVCIEKNPFKYKYYRNKLEKLTNLRVLSPICVNFVKYVFKIEVLGLLDYLNVEMEFSESNFKEPLIYSTADYNDLKELTASYLYKTSKVGDIVFYYNRGSFKVTKISNDSKNGAIYFLSSLTSDENLTVSKNDNHLYYLPYNQKREIDIFCLNKENHECNLQAFAYRKYNVINIMWQSFDGAKRYIIALYSYINSLPGDSKFYHLKDYYLDKNECYLSIADYIFDNYLVKIIVEDSEGNIIAETKGIENGKPKIWQ